MVNAAVGAVRARDVEDGVNLLSATLLKLEKRLIDRYSLQFNLKNKFNTTHVVQDLSFVHVSRHLLQVCMAK